jgi:hypothetical protein
MVDSEQLVDSIGALLVLIFGFWLIGELAPLLDLSFGPPIWIFQAALVLLMLFVLLTIYESIFESTR